MTAKASIIHTPETVKVWSNDPWVRQHLASLEPRPTRVGAHRFSWPAHLFPWGEYVSMMHRGFFL